MFLRACRTPFGAAAVFLGALAATACTQERVNADPQLAQLVERFGASEISRLPEEADRMGLPEKTFGRPYGALVNDRSMAVTERMRADHLDFLAAFERIDRANLSPDAARTYDAVRFALEATIAADMHGYGQTSPGWASPYLITFADGAYLDLVKLLTLHAPIASRAEADAWLARLGEMANAMRDERRRFSVDLDAGATPPRAVIQRTLDKVRQLAPANPKEHLLVLYFTEQLAQVTDIPEADIATLSERAAELVGGEIKDEYGELISLLQARLAKADDAPGIWRLPEGEAYYRDTLKLHTTTAMTAAQLSEAGRKLVETLTAELDPLLVEAGLAEGSVGERLRMLATNPEHQFPETPEGRLALLAYVGDRMDWAESAVGRVINTARSADIIVRESPRIAQDTAPKAYYRPAAVNGSQPAVYNLTLRTTADFPVWMLPTLTFHEAVPGHHLQVEQARVKPDAPVISYLIATPAFAEGWATYAEDLAFELGAYEEDPLGKIGYLQSMLYRAARMVADTGIHAQRWTRQEAIDYLVTTVGLAQGAAELEVDRYSIRPGLACTYMTGRETIRRLRSTAQKELGAKFDLKAFHAAILAPGPRPLPVVEADIAAWVAGQKPAPAPPE